MELNGNSDACWEVLQLVALNVEVQSGKVRDIQGIPQAFFSPAPLFDYSYTENLPPFQPCTSKFLVSKDEIKTYENISHHIRKKSCNYFFPSSNLKIETFCVKNFPAEKQQTN